MDSEVGRLSAMQASLLEVISVAEYAAANGVTLVTLILTYSAIDTLGWLAAKHDDEQVSVRFQNWVERYMLRAAPRLN